MWGAVVGDIAGSRFEGSRGGPKDFELFHRLCAYTDDTVCTAAIADIIVNKRKPNVTLQRWCRRHPDRGYGGYFREWIESAVPTPYGSFGNGAATLWRTYFTLTDLEAVFRSLKSELGLRPIYHHKPVRAEGNLFITVIAYQLVQVIRRRLRESDETASWTTLRRILEGQQRITATFRRADGRTLHVRKATRAEAPQQALYDALGVGSAPGGIRKSIV